VLTHFHFDHVCGLPYLSWCCDGATIWAPGKWLYDRDSAEILESLRRPPVAPSDVTGAFRAAAIFERVALGEDELVLSATSA